jgi:hypothetical protein
VGLLFGRVWRVVIGAQIGAIRAGLQVDDHRIYFHVEKSLKPEPNTCTLKVYNLSRTQRAQIEELKPKKGDTRGIPILIEAGYKDKGPQQIWLGDVRTVSTERDGGDWITTLESGDGEKAGQNARINVAYGPGTTPDTALRAIVKALGVDPGNVPQVLTKLRATGVGQLFPKRLVLSGSAVEHMTNFCRSAGLEWSIQEGAVQILDVGATSLGFVTRLSPSTGLVGVPSVDPEGKLSCTSLIQSGLRPGSLLVLESSAVRGNYRIERTVWEGDTHDTPWYAEIEGSRY